MLQPLSLSIICVKAKYIKTTGQTTITALEETRTEAFHCVEAAYSSETD
jgi:hypothetical protein